jgi:hypothetical protein
MYIQAKPQKASEADCGGLARDGREGAIQQTEDDVLPVRAMHCMLPAVLLFFAPAPRDPRCRPCTACASFSALSRVCAQASSAALQALRNDRDRPRTGAAHHFKKRRLSAASKASKRGLKHVVVEDEEMSSTLASSVRRMTLAEKRLTEVAAEEVQLDLTPSTRATAVRKSIHTSVSDADHVTGSV